MFYHDKIMAKKPWEPSIEVASNNAARMSNEDEDFDDEADLDEIDADDEPQWGDYVTEDHIYWYEHGTSKLLLTTQDASDRYSSSDDYKDQLKAHMTQESFWPNACGYRIMATCTVSTYPNPFLLSDLPSSMGRLS